jgi:hypothetical protein
MHEPDTLSVAAGELLAFARAGLRVDSFAVRLRLMEGAPLLNALPAVHAAGPDATARFEYLAQAVVDAIDDLSRTGADADPHLNGHHPEAAALRQLFGLTERTRRASWRVRQEAAASMVHVSWEHFRRAKQSLLLRAVTERLLANAAAHAETSADVRRSLVAVAAQQDVEASIVEYIQRRRPARADLLELSTATILPVLRALRSVGTDVRLLVANPAGLHTTPFMSERIRYALANLFAEFGSRSGFEVRAYNTAPSVRGRSIGTLIALGWYTYRDNKRLDEADGVTTEIWGHDNALLLGDVSEANGAVLATWFGREFERLWEHRRTEDESVLHPQL